MLEKVKIIKINGIEYPTAFTFRVMEEIQEEYGTVTKWQETMYPDNERYPNIKAFRWTLLQTINEGIRKLNKTKAETRGYITEVDIEELLEISFSDVTALESLMIAQSEITRQFFKLINGEKESPNEKTTKGKKTKN